MIQIKFDENYTDLLSQADFGLLVRQLKKNMTVENKKKNDA